MIASHVTQIPFPGNSGHTPTGAMQFQDDWPGLFIRGDDAIVLMGVIQDLSKRLAQHPDPVVHSRLRHLFSYADAIAANVIVKRNRVD